MVDAITVTGEGKQIVLDFPSLGEALQLWKPWTDGRRRAEITEMLHSALNAAGLSLELRVKGKPVASLGGAEMSGLILQLLSLNPIFGPAGSRTQSTSQQSSLPAADPGQPCATPARSLPDSGQE